MRFLYFFMNDFIMRNLASKGSRKKLDVLDVVVHALTPALLLERALARWIPRVNPFSTQSRRKSLIETCKDEMALLRVTKWLRCL